MLVSDAIAIAGTGDGRGRIGGLEVEVVGERVDARRARRRWPARSSRSTPRSGTSWRRASSLPAAVAAAGRNPLALLGISDRGRIAVGQRADLVELDDELRVRRVMRGGHLVRRRPG